MTSALLFITLQSQLKTMKLFPILLTLLLLAALTWLTIGGKFDANPRYTIGQEIDQYNGVAVYYNGSVGHVAGRNTTPDGYNLGLKYQCVEFVKRYYYQHLRHKMPDSYGHAKDFFIPSLADGKRNKQRNLIQYHNSSPTKPKPNDILVFGATKLNPYGHVAIITKVTDTQLEIIQQNAGPYGPTHQTLRLRRVGGKWEVRGPGVLGWLGRG
jgi:hypothetical protein